MKRAIALLVALSIPVMEAQAEVFLVNSTGGLQKMYIDGVAASSDGQFEISYSSSPKPRTLTLNNCGWGKITSTKVLWLNQNGIQGGLNLQNKPAAPTCTKDAATGQYVDSGASANINDVWVIASSGYLTGTPGDPIVGEFWVKGGSARGAMVVDVITESKRKAKLNKCGFAFISLGKIVTYTLPTFGTNNISALPVKASAYLCRKEGDGTYRRYVPYQAPFNPS